MKELQPYPEYKDTGIEWLGNVPRHWSLKRFKHLFRIKKEIAGELGHDVLSITQKGIKLKDIESGEGQLSMDYSKYQMVRKGDFAMNHMDLLTGFVDISKYDGVTSPDYRVFTLIDNANSAKYYLYLLQMGYTNKLFYPLGQGTANIGRWRLPREEFMEFLSPVPPCDEQELISSFLSSETQRIDTLIAEKQNFVSLLKEKRQALITHVVTKGLDPNVPMKDSGVEWLGKVPEHWVPKPICRVASVNDDVLPESTDETTAIRYVDISSVGYTDGIKQATEMDFIDAPSRARRKAANGDVIVSTVRTYLKAVAPVTDDYSDCIFSTGFAVLRARDLNHSFLKWAILNELLVQAIEAHSEGLSYPAINASTLVKLKIAVPPLEEQAKIANFLDLETSRFDILASETKKSINLLKEKRSALITAAVTGKIDIRNYYSDTEDNKEAV